MIDTELARVALANIVPVPSLRAPKSDARMTTRQRDVTSRAPPPTGGIIIRLGSCRFASS